MDSLQLNDEAIFRVARKIKPEARAAYVAQACGEDRGLRDEVDALLSALDVEGSFLESPALEVDVTSTAVWSVPTDYPGAAIGPYKLLEQIGEGGMGVVYVAEQHEPVRRRVALKVIKPGMDSRQVVARFQAERQALAMMDHPNIARVLDGGATGSGLPYFVMELVRGIPITDYCDREQLTIRERLELFVLVCRAVQHAHQKGIIHRDLKPSNILVTVIDGAAVPKVIDFGIAKATGAALTDRTIYTGFHQFVGTPLYMSPEQADLAGVDVDTRSDVYALGVLLYELLTGTTPFDSETLRKAAFDEMRRIIREDEPPRPSTRLSSLGATSTAVSGRRKVDPRRLNRVVRGELDWIAMKALEKDRTRRYETANDFAADVMRHLTDQPVEACPPSARYRLGKFVRRHRLVLTASALVTLAMVAGTAISTWQAREAWNAKRQSAHRYELARRAVDEMYTQVAEKWLNGQAKMTPIQREFLEKASEFYAGFAEERAGDPSVRLSAADAARRLGDIRAKLGQDDGAERAYRRAEADYLALVGVASDHDHVHLGLEHARMGLGMIFLRAGRNEEAERSLRVAIEAAEGEAREHPREGRERSHLAGALLPMGRLLANTGRVAEAEAVLRRAVGELEAVAITYPSEPAAVLDLAQGRTTYAAVLARLGRRERSEAAVRAALDGLNAVKSVIPPGSALRVSLAEQLGPVWHQMGGLLAAKGASEEAERSYREAVVHQERVVVEFPDVPGYRKALADFLNDLANHLMDDKPRLDEAERLTRQALAIREGLVRDHSDIPAYRSDLGGTRHGLGMILAERGDLVGKRRLLDEAIVLQRAALAADPRSGQARGFLRNHYHELTKVLVEIGDHAEAARTVVEMVEARLPEASDEPGFVAYAAAFHLVRCVGLAGSDKGLSPEQRNRAIESYGTQADAMIREAALRGENSIKVLVPLAELLLSLPTPGAAKEHAKALTLARRATKLDPKSPAHWELLGLAEYRSGDASEAIRAIEEAVKIRGRDTPHDLLIQAMATAQRGDVAAARACVARLPLTFDEEAWRTSRTLHDEAFALLRRVGALPEQGSPQPEEGRGTPR